MSRIGRMPIELPAGVDVKISAENEVVVKGPKGTLTKALHKDMIIKLIKENGISHSESEANEIVKSEIERICRNILINTAVYKDTEAGNKAIIKFLESADLHLV